VWVGGRTGRLFAAKGVKFAVPPLPKRLPSPDEPGLGYDPTGVKRYYNTEVFVEDCFLADGTIVYPSAASTGDVEMK
jgi:hypothetical protein